LLSIISLLIIVIAIFWNQQEELIPIFDSTSSKIPVKEKPIEIPELTPENVFKELVAHGVKEPEIVVKQSILETGWYKCKYCSLSKKNIFGFRKNKKYLEFDNWVESVAYYKYWQDKNYNGGNYYTFLKNIGYATSQEYVSKLKTVKLDFDTSIPEDSQFKTLLLAFVDYVNVQFIE
jgi:hypothetical protein